MTEDQRKRCENIINFYSSIAGIAGFGLAKTICCDTIPISAAQVAMVIRLGSVFGLSLEENTAKALIVPQLGTIIGKGGSKLANAAIGKIIGVSVPLVGNLINGATAVSLTEYLGRRIVKDICIETLYDDDCYSESNNIISFKREKLNVILSKFDDLEISLNVLEDYRLDKELKKMIKQVRPFIDNGRELVLSIDDSELSKIEISELDESISKIDEMTETVCACARHLCEEAS